MQAVIQEIKKAIDDQLIDIQDAADCPIARVKPSGWRDAMGALKSRCGFDLLLDICGVDHFGEGDRFEVVAHLMGVKTNVRIRVKTRCKGVNHSVQSLSDIYAAADWFERETYDLFGIYFEGHPNLARILCPDDFEGHALRKDFSKNQS